MELELTVASMAAFIVLSFFLLVAVCVMFCQDTGRVYLLAPPVHGQNFTVSKLFVAARGDEAAGVSKSPVWWVCCRPQWGELGFCGFARG